MIAYIVGGNMTNSRVSVWRKFVNAHEALDWLSSTYAVLVHNDTTRKGLLTYGVLEDNEEEDA